MSIDIKRFLYPYVVMVMSVLFSKLASFQIKSTLSSYILRTKIRFFGSLFYKNDLNQWKASEFHLFFHVFFLQFLCYIPNDIFLHLRHIEQHNFINWKIFAMPFFYFAAISTGRAWICFIMGFELTSIVCWICLVFGPIVGGVILNTTTSGFLTGRQCSSRTILSTWGFGFGAISSQVFPSCSGRAQWRQVSIWKEKKIEILMS